MKRLTNKELSVKHEDFIAAAYNGVRSKSSGAAVHDDGDVRNSKDLLEAKVTRKMIPAKLKKEFEKVAREAWGEGRHPVLCARYYDPDSLLSDHEGFVDFTIRLTSDDKMRHYGS